MIYMDRERRILGPEGIWPYMPRTKRAKEEMLDWAEEIGATLYPSTRCRGLHWLNGRRCPRTSGCIEGRWIRPIWYDHVSRWNTPEGRLMIAQPYPASRGVLEAELAELGPGYDVRIGQTGWYGMGTRWVEIRTSPALVGAGAR